MSTNRKGTTNVGLSYQVTPKQLPAILASIRNTNKDLPPNQQLVPFIMSAPGVGKSSICEAFAKANNLHFTDIRLAYAAPTDVRGFPMVAEKDGHQRMEFAYPAEYPTTPHGVLLLDEFSCATRQTQLAALQLLLDKKVGDYKVPDDILIIVAGNRAKDRAHVERLSSAVINRIVQIELRVDLDEWSEYACNTAADPRMIAFVRFRPDCLSDFDAANWNGDDGFASPRSIMMVSNLLKGEERGEKLPFSLRAALIHGMVGPKAGSEIVAFLKIYESLPDVDAMLKKPKEAQIPGEPSILWALIAALAPRANDKNMDKIIELTDRCPKEFQVLCIKMIMKRDAKLMSTSSGNAWILKNAKDLA